MGIYNLYGPILSKIFEANNQSFPFVLALDKVDCSSKINNCAIFSCKSLF